MAFDQSKQLRSIMAELKKAGLPSNEVFISDGVLTKQQMIEQALSAMLPMFEKWEAKANDAAAMASSEFKKFCEMQKDLAAEMKAQHANIKKSDEVHGKLMTKYRADKKIGPLLVKMNPILGAAVAFVDGKNLAVKPIVSKAKDEKPKSSQPATGDGESPYGKSPKNLGEKPEPLYSMSPKNLGEKQEPLYSKSPKNLGEK